MKSVKLNTLLKTTITLLFLTAVLFQVGCASQQPDKSDSSSDVAEVAQPELAPDVVDDYDGDGMYMPLDGTSLLKGLPQRITLKRLTMLLHT